VAKRRQKHPPGSGGIAFGELIAIFQPGVEHLIEERERKQHDLVTPGSAGPDWDIDLDARVARLGSADEAPPEPEPVRPPEPEPAGPPEGGR
jgi:hypothetical protein